MDTIREVKDQFARDHGFKNWNEFKRDFERGGSSAKLYSADDLIERLLLHLYQALVPVKFPEVIEWRKEDPLHEGVTQLTLQTNWDKYATRYFKKN